MLKKVLFISVALLLMFSLSACSGDTSPGELTVVKDKFTVGFDQDFPPMGFVGEDGKFTGFDLDLAAEVADRLGLDLVLQPIAWDSKDMELS